MSVTPQGSPPANPQPDGQNDTSAPGSISDDPTRADVKSSAVRAPATRAAGSDMFGASTGGDTSGFGGLVRKAPPGLSTPRPYGGWFDESVDALQESFPGFGEVVQRVVVDRGELTLHVHPQKVAELCSHLRDSEDHRYEVLLGVSGVDFPSQPERLHVVYHLLSMTYRRRLRLETAVPESSPHVVSVCHVYPTADFHERETWDMFGVVFDDHPGLTRILMPDDWDGHPQRKDYPLGGVPVEYKGAQIPPPDERRSYA